MGRRGTVAVARDPYGANNALFFCLDCGLKGAAWTRSPVQVLEVAYRVELKQVDVIDAHAFYGVVDLALRRILLAQACLGGEEDAVPDLGHPASVLQLRVPVVGRRVEVIHAGVERL